MARRTTLVQLLTDLRAETRSSLNPAHNVQVRDQQINILQRTQTRLYDDFAWPHLYVELEIPVQAGQRFYDMPESMNIDRLEKIEVFSDGGWLPLLPGIDSSCYSAINSELNERSWPPRRWRISADEMVELWPIADQNASASSRNGYLKFSGIRKLNKLVDNDDRADLDDRLIVLYAASEILASDGAKDASLKLDAANLLYAKLRSGLTPRRRFQMFGVGERKVPMRSMITRYRPAGS